MIATDSPRGATMVRVRTSQKFFTEDEVTNITGICVSHLQTLARNKHLGTVVHAAEAAGSQAEKWLFSHSELMILTVIHPRCQH
jgi:phage gp46-like protein